MPKISKMLLLAASAVLVLTIFMGVNASGVSAASDTQEGAYNQINVYREVLGHIQNDYVEQPDLASVTNGALRGLLESLDADSSYLSPDDYKLYKMDKGGKAQIGINVSKRFGYANVVSVVPGSPAEKGSLVDGDILEAIDGTRYPGHSARDDPEDARRAAGIAGFGIGGAAEETGAGED